MIPPIFAGKTVAICAGGPSLRGFNWRRLEYANCVAINRSFEVLPFAKMLWWGDATFFRLYYDALHEHPCIWKGTFRKGYAAGEIPDWVTGVYDDTGREGFDPNPEKLRTGNNSTYAVMHLLAHHVPERIILFGVDMKTDAGGQHWHDGYPTMLEPEGHAEILEGKMRPLFAGLVQPLAERGIEVINASPESALDLWPRCSIDEGVELATQDRLPRDPAD